MLRKVRNVRVGLYQMEVVPKRPDINLRKIKMFFEKVGKKGVDLVVFPEKFNGILTDKEYDEEITDLFLKGIGKLGRKYKVYVVAGSLLYKENGKYYNRSFFFDKKGRILGYYDKIKLIKGVEDEYTSRGNKLVVYEAEIGKIGVCVCLDITEPNIVKEYKNLGVEIVVCPAMWERKFSWDDMVYKDHKIDLDSAAESVVKKITHARAVESEVFVVFCNAAGKFDNGDFCFELYGGSNISVPLYGVDKKIKGNSEGVLIYEIDLEMIKIAEKYDLFHKHVVDNEIVVRKVVKEEL